MTLLANAGVLFAWGGISLLADGIFDCSGYPFPNLPEAVWSALLDGRAPFEHIDFLLITHDHPDHFSEEMTCRYLEKHPVKGIFAPKEIACGSGRLAQLLGERKIPCALLSEDSNRTKYRIAPGITVQAVKTLHLDRKFAEVPHFCFLLSFGEKRVLLTSDVDYTAEEFSWLGQAPVDAALVNPLFFHELCSPHYFHGSLSAEKLLVYHLPSENDTALQTMLSRDLERRDLPWKSVIPMDTTLKTLIL